MNRLGAALMMLCAGSACAQSWNNLRNDYRVQENNGFAYMYAEDGVLDYMPRIDMGIWNVSYFDWNLGASNLYAVGHQMQPSASILDSNPQSAICRWTSPVDGNYTVRYSFARDSSGYGAIVSVGVSETADGSWELRGDKGQGAFGSFVATVLAGESVWLRVDPVELTAGDAINFELAVFGPCQADLDHDSLVDDSDFVAFVYHYDRLESVGGDFNDDGLTDDADFVAFAQAYDALLCD